MLFRTEKTQAAVSCRWLIRRHLEPKPTPHRPRLTWTGSARGVRRSTPPWSSHPGRPPSSSAGGQGVFVRHPGREVPCRPPHKLGNPAANHGGRRGTATTQEGADVTSTHWAAASPSAGRTCSRACTHCWRSARACGARPPSAMAAALAPGCHGFRPRVPEAPPLAGRRGGWGGAWPGRGSARDRPRTPPWGRGVLLAPGVPDVPASKTVLPSAPLLHLPDSRRRWVCV